MPNESQYNQIIQELFIKALDAYEDEKPAQWLRVREAIAYAIEEEGLTNAYRKGLAQLLNAVDFCEYDLHKTKDIQTFIDWHARYLNDQDLSTLVHHYVKMGTFSRIKLISIPSAIMSGLFVAVTLAGGLDVPELLPVWVATLTASLALWWSAGRRIEEHKSHIRPITVKSRGHLRRLIATLCAPPTPV
jgi:hypothetical protein